MVAEIYILAQILFSKIRFVLFSYTRILYPFCEKAIGKPITEGALKEPNYGAINQRLYV